MIGVILAGGKSTRFKGEKAMHQLNHKAFFHHVYDAMKESKLERIIISTNESLYREMMDYSQKHNLQDISFVIDEITYKEKGPLVGIYSAMKSFESESYFVCSVDTPFITGEVIDYLIDQHYHSSNYATVYKDDEQIHRTIAIYSRHLYSDIQHSLNTNQLALRTLTQRHTTYIHVDEVKASKYNLRQLKWYDNINTRHDLFRALKERGSIDGANSR